MRLQDTTPHHLLITLKPYMTNKENSDPDLLEKETELMGILTHAVVNKYCRRIFDGTRSYFYFEVEGAKLLPKATYFAIWQLDGRFDGGYFYTPVVAESRLDDLVPVGWPKSTKTVGETQVQKSFREYAMYWQTGVDEYVILCKGPKVIINNKVDLSKARVTDETIRAWKTEFSGFLTHFSAQNLIDAWEEQ